MTEDRSKAPRTPRLARRPVVAAAAVLLTAVVIAAGQAFGVQAADVAPMGAAPAPLNSGAPERQRAAVEPVAVSDVTPPPTGATPSPTGSGAPMPAPTPAPAPAPTPSATTNPAPTPSSTPAPAPTPTAPASGPVPTAAPAPGTASPGLLGGPAAAATLGSPGSPPVYLPAGQPLTDLLPFQPFRVVVQLGNGGPGDAPVTPRLEYRVVGEASYRVVPDEAVPGIPLHAAKEWVPAKVGTNPAPETTTTAADEARLAAPAGMARAAGHRSSGGQTAPRYSVLPGTVTEQEFTAALSIDAVYGASYELLVTDAGTAIGGLAPVRVTVSGTPESLHSPGQRQGSAAGTAAMSGTATTLPTYRLVSQSTTTSTTATRIALQPPSSASRPSSATAVTAATFVSETTAAVRFANATRTAATAVYPLTVGPAGPATIHDPYSSTTSGQCSVCHQTHTGRSGALVKATTTTEQCYTCHADGVAGADVQAQYAIGQPANDPATRSYWSHDTADATTHTLDTNDEFAARLDRHSQCTDCHDPHGTTSDTATMTPAGWTAPGGLANVSGVAVSNGAAGTAPGYTWLDGTVAPVTAEYQLCFKCHSGYTTLPGDVPGKPSQGVSDLAVELNPANASYHPIEAPGRNQTLKLADSLAGPSPYKLWNFSTGDTVRCVSCHSSNTTGTSSDPAENTPGATLTVHASTNRGILTRPYENRVLSASGQSYDNQGFALCLTCHTETPYMNQRRPAAAAGTNFVFHGLHMSGISTEGSGGLDIDTPGAGQGNARCAECHFSSHGTTEQPSAQNVSGDNLVVFGPDVAPSQSMGGVPTFTKTATRASCTLTCHGQDHQGATYSIDPATSIGYVPVGG